MGLGGIVIVPIIWALMGLILYVIIRFGVKHGMRSYYAEAARRAIPADGIIGAESTGPTAAHPDEDSGTNSPEGPKQ
jgi:hypothetical protein